MVGIKYTKVMKDNITTSTATTTATITTNTTKNNVIIVIIIIIIYLCPTKYFVFHWTSNERHPAFDFYDESLFWLIINLETNVNSQ